MDAWPSFLNRSLSTTCCSTIPVITNRKTKKPERRQLPPFRRTLPNSLPYPKPTPTPLLTTGPAATAPKSREQHLDAILRDIETSVARGIIIDPATFSSLLEACYQVGSFDRAPQLHSLIPRSLLRRSTGLAAKLLRLYAARGDVDNAHRLFDEMRPADRNRDAFAWNALISGYADRGDHEDAMALYYQMVEEDGVAPDRFTFPRVLKACAGIGSLAVGEAAHRDAVRRGFGDDPYVRNALVDMYAKCGDVAGARRVFDVIPPHCRDVVSWNSMIVGYARHGLYLQAVGVCRDMLRSGPELSPDSVALSSILSALPYKTSRFGPEIHGWALRKGLVRNLPVANALITMYADQDRPNCARAVFDAIIDKDVVSWNAIFSAHRRDPRALSLFRQMQEDTRVQPDQVTFVLLLSACARLGLVSEGLELFALMAEYGIVPGMEHYSCMVNLLGRAGLVDEAYQLVCQKMPFDGGPTVWGALLYACSVHGNVAVGEVAAERLFDLEPDNGHNFELLMEVYSAVGRLEDVERVRKMMTDRGLDS